MYLGCKALSMNKTVYILFALIFFLSSCKIEKQKEGTVTEPAFTVVAKEPSVPVKSRTAMYLDSLGLINISDIDSTIQVRLMYATSDNFTGQLLYEDLREAYLHPNAARAVVRAQQLLQKEHPGYRLLIHDATRPLHIQQKMWNVVKGTSKSIYVSNPARGGGLHNYGLAVDISIIDEQGQPLDMGTPVDYLGVEAHIDQENRLVTSGKMSEEALQNRLLLRNIMKEAGFRTLPSEWWHFNLHSRDTAKQQYKLIQ